MTDRISPRGGALVQTNGLETTTPQMLQPNLRALTTNLLEKKVDRAARRRQWQEDKIRDSRTKKKRSPAATDSVFDEQNYHLPPFLLDSQTVTFDNYVQEQLPVQMPSAYDSIIDSIINSPAAARESFLTYLQHQQEHQHSPLPSDKDAISKDALSKGHYDIGQDNTPTGSLIDQSRDGAPRSYSTYQTYPYGLQSSYGAPPPDPSQHGYDLPYGYSSQLLYSTPPFRRGLSMDADDHQKDVEEKIEPRVERWQPGADVRASERLYIPGLVGHLMVKALPDTGAKYNFMKESHAKRLGLPIQRGTTHSITITKAKTIKTVGVVVAPFTFQGETESHLLKFHLLQDCVHDVILGKAFLKVTKTFSNIILKARRVITNFTRGLATLRLNYLGDSAPRFTGLLNGRIHQALGDTGAQGLFMSEAFARSNGFLIVDDPGNTMTVQYADGSTATTMGMTYGINWEYGLGGRSMKHVLDFYILKDAPADIILSDDFLHGTEAFAAYDCYLIDVDDEDEDDEEEDQGHLFAIKLFKKRVQSGM
jgi:predicted aspartyl protease